LPSSLTRVLPIALGFSPSLPVSVCGTGTWDSTLRGFSRQCGFDHFRPYGTAITSRAREADLPTSVIALQAWHRDDHHPAGLPSCVPPSLLPGGAGILTGCPSPTPLGLGLGPPNPTRINLPSETSGFRRTRFSRVLRYSCRHSHFRPLHRSFRYGFHAGRNAPLPSGPSLCPKPVIQGSKAQPRIWTQNYGPPPRLRC